jgi:CIC family chloride channel protein
MPQVLGLGEDTMQQVLDPNAAASAYGFVFLASLVLAKLVASVSCLGLRYPGGVFSPALFMGASLGGLFGFAAPFLDYQICVLVGMGALVSSVIGAPIATILIVFELTENYQAATAVMIAVVSANALLTRFYARSIFHRQVLRWGIDLERPREQRRLAARRVSEIMSRRVLAVKPARTATELKTFIDRGHVGDVFVVEGEERRLIGRVPLAVLVAAQPGQTARELSQPVEFCVEEGEDLWSGLLGVENFVGFTVPVVSDATAMKLVGVVTESDFISAYRQAVEEVREDKDG